MRILSLATLRSFYESPSYADAKANWRAPSEVKPDFGNASILKEGRVVFSIAGNKYRLVPINNTMRSTRKPFEGLHHEHQAC